MNEKQSVAWHDVRAELGLLNMIAVAVKAADTVNKDHICSAIHEVGERLSEKVDLLVASFR